ncbi:MAG: fibronectin type III domain-containing protein [Cytophaga sp.]
MNTPLSFINNKIRMKILFLILTGLLLVGAPLQQAFAQQQYPVQIQPTVSFPSTFLNDYADPENTNVRVYLADLTKVNYKINIRVKIEGTGNNVVYESINGINITLDGGQVYFLSDQDLALLFATTNLTTNAAAQTGFANSLPEGVYNMSFEAFDANLLPVKIPVSNSRTDFTLFNVVRYDPPMLNAPNNAEAFDMQTINQNIFFTWTPRHVVYSPKQQVKYRFSLIKVIPVDRNPYDAMKAAVPTSTGNIVVSDLDFPTFIYSPADLPLEEGCVYAWQVQAYEVVNGIQKATSRFKNEGYSEVFTFSVKENCEPVTINPVSVSGNQVTLSWFGSTISTYSEYEVNYRQAMTSLPWTPVLTSQTSITLDNTVLQSDVTYEFTVKARCKNWQSPVYGGTFKIEPATCVAPRPITVDTKSGSPVLTWIDNAGIDSIRLYYREKSSTAPFTRVLIAGGTQTYTLPPLSQDGYIVELDAVCGTETAAGIKDTFNYNDNGPIGPCPIPMPFQFSAQRVVGDTAMLGWQQVPGNTGYSITYWHKDSAAVTHTINNLLTPSTKANLLFDNQLYAYKVTFMCGTKTTTTPVGMFRIDGTINSVPLDPKTADCFPPVDLQGQARSTTSAFVEWNKIDGADEYQLFYGVKGTKPFKPFTTTATSTTLKNLEDSKQYQFVVRVRCGGLYSIFSDTALVDLGQTIDSKNCDTVAFVAAIKKTTTNILLAWKYNANYSGYIITYRESAQPPSSVYTQAFTNIDTLVQNHLYGDSVKYTFQNLKAGTEYLFTIQAVCGAGKAFINAPLKVSTMPDAKSSGTCGSANACDKTDKTPLTALNVGDKFHCADYEVTVDKIDNPSSSTGMYTGNGHMNMPIAGVGDFVTMNISFSNIKINTDPNRCVVEGIINIDSINAGLLPTDLRKQIGGYMDQVTDAIDQANNLLTQASDGLNQAQNAVQQATDYFQGGENTGSVVTGELGETKVTGTVPTSTTSATVSGNSVTLPPCPAVTVASFPVLLKDDAGNVFQVSSTGAVVHVGTYDNTYAVSAPVTVDPGTQQVVFEENTTAKYDFDMWKPEYKGVLQIEREYEKISSDYYVPSKCITPGELDVVNAKLSGTGADPAKVVFANGKGFVYKVTPGNTVTINLAGGPAADAQEIYAWYVDGSTKTAIGKLLVPSYGRQTKNVVIIPVDLVKNTRQTISTTVYENFLNKTYGRLGITYHVTVDDAFRGNTSWDADGNNSVQVKGSPILSNDYQGEEKAMIEAYVALKGGASALDPNTAYFLAPYEVSQIESNLLGKMPAEEQFGFLYTASTTPDGIARTIAHELGHGAYHLEHIFNSAYLGPGKNDAIKNGSLNLMSYYNNPKANELWKFQWDIVNAPGHVWGILQKDKDVKNMVLHDYIPETLWNTNKTCSFITPDGSQITLPNTVYNTTYMFGIPGFYSDNMTLVTGTLMSFYLPIDDKSGQRYRAYIDSDDKFQGYYKADVKGVLSNEKLDTKLLADGYENSVIMLYPLSTGWYMERLETASLASYKDGPAGKDIIYERISPVIVNKNTTKKASYHWNFTTNNTGEGQTSLHVDYVDMLKAHETGPEFLAVVKILQLKIMYPALFQNFCADFDDWSDSGPIVGSTFEAWDKQVEETPTLYTKWKNDPEAFYLEMIDEFYAYLLDQNSQKFSNFYKSFIQDETGFNQGLLLSALPLFSNDEIESLDITDRIKAIGLLAANAPSTNGPLEEQIIRLIRYTPSTDCNDLLTKMQEYNPIIEANKTKFPERNISSRVLVYQLIGGFSTNGIPFNDDGNYGDLISAFINVCNRSQTFYDAAMAKDADLANFEKNAVVYRYSSIWVVARNALFLDAATVLNFDPMNYDTDITLITQKTTPQTIDLNVKQENCIGGFSNCTDDDLGTFNIFEPVWVKSDGSLSILSSVIGQQGAWLPAFVLKYADDKGNDQTTSDVVNAAIDAAGLFTGVAELRAGVRGLEMAMALSDVLVSSVGLVDNATNGQISQNFPTFKACADAMDLLSGAIGLSQALKNGLSKSKSNLADTYPITKDLTSNTPAQITQYTDNYLNSVDAAASETMNWSSLPPDVRTKHITFTEYIAVQAQIANNTTMANRAKAILVKMKNSFSALYTKYKKIDLTLGTTGDLVNASGVKVAKIDNTVLKLESNVDLSTVTATDVNSVTVDVTSIEVGGTTLDVTNPKLVKTGTGYTCIGDGSYCFVAGTPVLTAAGEYVPIEKITSGNIVSSYDHKLKANVANRVTNTFSKTANRLVKLIIGGTLLWATADHPLYANDKYTQAKELHVGDSILSYDGKKQVVESINIVDTIASVYNFEVADYHNYFAGKNALLVHNLCSFLTTKGKITLASDWTNFQANLISSKIPAAERLSMYNKLATLSAPDLNAWVKNFNDPKVLAELNRIYADPNKLKDYPTLFTDITADPAKMSMFKDVLNDPVEVYVYLNQGLYSSNINTWLNGKMWTYVNSGKTFENTVGGLLDISEAGMISKLEAAFGYSAGSGKFAGFTSVSQLQINVGNTYFVADRALIKNLGGGKFDVYIFEMKITPTTGLTVNQTDFITAYNSGTKSFTTRSTNKGTTIPAGSTINVLGAKRINGPIDNYTITTYQ